MTYETAKKLREAGFPFDKKAQWSDWTEESGIGKCNYCGSRTLDIENDAFLIPTSDELIRGLGDKVILWYKGNQWAAGFGRESEVGETYIDCYPNPIEYGDEPNEALAELYIAISNGKRS